MRSVNRLFESLSERNCKIKFKGMTRKMLKICEINLPALRLVRVRNY